MNGTLRAGLVASLLLASPFAQAANFCVGDATELQDAFDAAYGNGEDDTIRIKTGTYTGGSGVAFAYNTSQNFDLTVSGGWTDFAMNECFTTAFSDPTDTVLSGSDLRPVLLMGGTAGTSGAMTLRNLTIRDGNSSGSGGGLRLGVAGGFAGDLLVERVLFQGNVAAVTAGGASISSEGIVTVRNNWFRSNRCGSDICAAELVVTHTSDTVARVFIGNNTLTGNACSAGAPVTCDNGGIRIGGSARFAIFNNAFYNNSGSDIRLQATNVLFNNSYQLQDGNDTPVSSGGNINPANPGFVNAAGGDFRLLATSPLVNAGTGAFIVGTSDFDGLARLNGAQYDIGAFENDNTVFQDGFEPIL